MNWAALVICAAIECLVTTAGTLAQPAQSALSIKLSAAQSDRQVKREYIPSAGRKICWATTNEYSANPKGEIYGGPTRYSVYEKTCKSAKIDVRLPCAGTSTAGVLKEVGQQTGSSVTDGQSRIIQDLLGSCLTVSGNSWLDLEYVFITVPDNQTCPGLTPANTAHPIPWVKFDC